MREYHDYVQRSIERLKAFEPPEGYFVAFSGGKDSQCIYHLCEMAGVKFDAHYSVTSVDPPELVRFIRVKYPNVAMEIPHDKDGKPITMWNLIPRKLTPPMRNRRYCCSVMKEVNGIDRVTVTGVRWAESINRKNTRGIVDIHSESKRLREKLAEAGADYHTNKNGGIIMNDDNDITRRMVEQCYRTHKTIVNPIVDWSEDEVWKFLREIAQVESCSLYAEGFKRLGCIGCPMAGKMRTVEFARWTKYKEMYMRAFERMIEEREKRGLMKETTNWKTPEDVFEWWMETGVLPGQIRIDELMMEE